MGCLTSLLKTTVIFGAGMYTGVYVAQNYKVAMTDICNKAKECCDSATKDWLAFYFCFFSEPGIFIDKVEDPKVLFEKAQAFIKSKLDEFDNGKKNDK